jgi:MFS family permease
MSTNQGLGRAFRHRSFVALWLSSGIATLGDSYYRVALAWWVMEKTGSGLAMGTVVICGIVPSIPFLLIGGVLSDRSNRVNIMSNIMFLRCALSGSLAVLAITDNLEIWHVYTAAGLFGVFGGFYFPALSAVIPQVVPPEDRPSANALRGVTRQLASVLGPLAAAATVTTDTNWLGFAVHSVGFGVAAISIQWLRKLHVPPRAQVKSNIIGDVRAGFAFIKREPWLWVTILAFFVINPACAPMFNIVLSFFVKANSYDASALGILEAVVAAGTVVGGMWLGRRAKIPRRGWVLYLAVAAQGLAWLLFPISGSLWGLAGLAGFAGFLGSIYTLTWTTLMQDFVPDEQFGRVSSLDQITAVITVPLGVAAAGWGLDEFGVTTVCLIAGALTTLPALAALAHPKIREID